MWINRLDRWSRIRIFLSFFVLLITSYIFIYGDCIAYTTWSVNIWDALAQGKINDYFTVTFERTRQTYWAGNPFGVLYLLPWAIWNIPIWLTHYFNGNLYIATPLCIFWSKLFLVNSLLGLSFFSAKIVKYFTNDDDCFVNAFCLILGSATIMTSVGYHGQDEVVYMFIFVAGMYYWYAGNKKISLLFFLMSVVLCNLMIIPLAIFIAVYEKNIIKVFITCIVGLIPEKIISLICGSSKIEELLISSGQQNYSFGEYLQWYVNSNGFQIGIGYVSLFLMSIVLILGIAFFGSFKDNDTTSLLLVGIALLFPICTFAWNHSYRLCTSVPLTICLVLIKGKKNDKTIQGIFLLVVWSFLLLIATVSNDYTFKFSDCVLLTDNPAISLWYCLLGRFQILEGISMMLPSLMVAIELLIFIYCIWNDFGKHSSVISLFFLELVYSLLPVIFLLIYFGTYWIYDCDYRRIMENDKLSIGLNNETHISQSFEAKGAYLDFIEIRPVTYKEKYDDNDYLVVTLFDSDDNEIYRKSILANELPDNQIYRIYFKINIDKDRRYRIDFTGAGLSEDESKYVYMIMNDYEKDDNVIDVKCQNIIEYQEKYNIFNSICMYKL